MLVQKTYLQSNSIQTSSAVAEILSVYAAFNSFL